MLTPLTFKLKCTAISTFRFYSTKPPLNFNRIPKKLIPYANLMRLDKPVGTWLLFLPCSWSILQAGSLDLTTLNTMGLFAVGSFLLRGAGCTINDMWDKNLDKQVERTKVRPLASGELKMKDAWMLLATQLSLGLCILVQLNVTSIILGASSLAFVVTYPVMKRITWWPQAFLGLTFNWGCLLGSVAILDNFNFPVIIPLYAAGICWTLVYDTIYALQDKIDDKTVGIKSTALKFGDDLKKWLTGFAVLSVGFLTISGLNNDQGLLFYLVSVGGASAHYFWQIFTLKPNVTKDCAHKFTSNKYFGLIVAVGILLDKLFG